MVWISKGTWCWPFLKFWLSLLESWSYKFTISSASSSMSSFLFSPWNLVFYFEETYWGITSISLVLFVIAVTVCLPDPHFASFIYSFPLKTKWIQFTGISWLSFSITTPWILSPLTIYCYFNYILSSPNFWSFWSFDPIIILTSLIWE